MTRAERHLAAQIVRARAALLWERAAPVLAPVLAALAVYLVLALFGVFERFGDPWRLIALAALVLGGGWGAVRALAGWRAPSRRDAERRVEDDSGLDGRPFEALRDAPAAGSDDWWAAHRARMEARLAQARTRRPKGAWAAMDPLGLRIFAVIVIGCGAFLAGDLAAPRLGDAFAPRLMAGGSAAGASVEMWIEPPAYTGRAVIYLRDRREARAPAGSVLAVRLAGTGRMPSVHGAPAEIETLSGDVRLLRITPEDDGEILIRAGGWREQVRLELIPDQPPQVRLAAEPSGDAQGRLVLELYAEDDYGVEELVFAFTAETGGAAEEITIPPGAVTVTGGEGLKIARLDLSRHRLAGERVRARVIAVDAIGQRGASGEIALTLPQRVFLDPLARAVASERRRFLGDEADYGPMPDAASVITLAGAFLDDEPDRRIERAPPGVQRLALALDAVSDAPHGYFDDPVVWMGLRTALRQVRRARERDALTHLDEDLWQIALRAELGSLADAEEALRAAEQALMDALARGADPIELSALFDAFERAVQVYMQALAREAAEAGRFAEGGGGGMSGMDSDSLQALLDAIREAAELGDDTGSRRALAQLTEMLRNMQITLSQGGRGQGEDSPMARALREALEELSEAIGEQRALTEDTFNRDRESGDRRSGGAAPRPPGARALPGDEETGDAPSGGGGGGLLEDDGQGAGAGFDDLAERQRALQDRLDAAEEALAGVPSGDEARAALEAARQAMEGAARALAEGDGPGALSQQDEALRALREASREAAEALEREAAGDADGADPLGRGAAGGESGETAVPSEAERQRARDILEELRRRAAERGRPQEELDYIDRLLERFRR